MEKPHFMQSIRDHLWRHGKGQPAWNSMYALIHVFVLLLNWCYHIQNRSPRCNTWPMLLFCHYYGPVLRNSFYHFRGCLRASLGATPQAQIVKDEKMPFLLAYLGSITQYGPLPWSCSFMRAPMVASKESTLKSNFSSWSRFRVDSFIPTVCHFIMVINIVNRKMLISVMGLVRL